MNCGGGAGSHNPQKGHLYSWPPSHTPKLNPIGRAVPEIQKCGLHVRTCRDTPPLTCVKRPSSWPQTDTPKLNPIGRAVPEIQKRGLHVRMCRDTPSMTCVKHLVHDPQPHIPKLNPIGRAVPEIQKRSVHVQRYPTRDYCISCNQWVPKCRTKFQCNRPNHYRGTASGTFIEKGCARAHVQMHSTHDLWKALSQLMTPNPHTKFEHNRPSRFGDTEARCGTYLCTCARAEIPHPWLLHKL